MQQPTDLPQVSRRTNRQRSPAYPCGLDTDQGNCCKWGLSTLQQILPILMLLVLVGSFALLAGQPPNSERDLHCLSARRPPPELQNPLVQPGLQSQDGEREESPREAT